jgi:hypothetical protein
MTDEEVTALFETLAAASMERQYLVASTLGVFTEDELATLRGPDLAINSFVRAAATGKLDQLGGLIDVG